MNILDHGAIELIDSMADDQRVCGAARISTGKDPSYTSKGEEADRKLINFLMSNGHGTPFEHAVFQFFVKAPIFVVREWQRHRMASYNEFSMRYAEVKDETAEFYVPDMARRPDPANKQSAVAWPEATILARNTLDAASRGAYDTYRSLIDGGLAREMARMVLPANVYTKFWFTVNCRSLLNFLMLRNHPSAQYEIKVYAEAMESILAEQMPWTYAAFVANGRRAP